MRLNIDGIKESRLFVTQVTKGAATLAVGMGVYTLCSFLFRYILIHISSPEEYGVFTLITTIVSLLGIFTEFNLSPTAAIFLGRDIKNPRNTKTVLVILVTFALLTIFFLFATSVFVYLSNSAAPTKEVLQRYFVPIWLLVIFTGVTGISWGWLRAHKKMNYESISNIVRGLSMLALIVIAAYLFSTKSMNIYIGILIIAQILALMIVVFIARKKLPDTAARRLSWQSLSNGLREVSLANVRIILLFAFYLSSISIGATLLTSIDRIMISGLLSSAMVGFYGGANLVAVMPRVITGTFALSLTAFIPERSRAPLEAKKQYLRLLVPFTGVAIAGYGIFVAVAPQVASLLLPGDYGWVVTTLRFLTVAMFFADVFGLNATFVSSLGRTKVLRQIIMVLAGAVAANIALNYILIPRFGIEGAAISSVISFALMAIISTVQVKNIKADKVL